MEKNPGRYGIAALAIAALLSAGACDRGTDNTATGMSERGTDTRTARQESSPSSDTSAQPGPTAGTAPGSASSSADTSSGGSSGSLASTTESGSVGQGSGAAASSDTGTPGVSGYTGPAETTGSTTGTTGSTTGTTGSGSATGTTGSTATERSGSTASGEMTRSKTLSSSDRNFVKEAAEDGMYEIAIARVASEKATDPEVKAFASKLVDDHTKAHDQLRQIAESRNLALPSSLPAAKQRNVDRLSSASGSDFDRQFLQMIGVKGHKEDIAEFERASRRARDAEIREFAKSALPTLREHLSSAQRLTASVGRGTGSTGTTTSPQGYTGQGDRAPGGSGMMESSPGGTTGSQGDMGSPSTPQGSSDSDRNLGGSTGSSSGTTGSGGQ